MVMKRLYMLPLFVAVIALCAAAAPPPKPTSVISGLGIQTASDGRYYSTLYPYSIKSAWKGSTYSDANGRRDRFTSGDRFIDLLSVTNSQHLTEATLDQAARAALAQDGFSPKVGTQVLISKQRIPVLVFSDSNGSYAEVVFILAGRIWQMALISDRTHAQRDLQVLTQAATSFRLEHGGQ